MAGAVKDGEMVGLSMGTNGRSCVQHGMCGDHLKVGDLVRFKKCVVEIDGVVEEVCRLIL